MKITTADSGRQCLDYAKKERQHIIFMDHMMRALEFLKGRTPDLILTSNGEKIV